MTIDSDSDVTALDRMPASTQSRRRRPEAPAVLRTAVPLLLAIVVLSVYSGAQNPVFMTSANWQNILAQVCVLGILAAGQTFLIIGGQLDLSVGSLVSLVGVFAADRFTAGWSTLAVVACCLTGGVIVGLVWGALVAYLRVPPFVLTLGGLSLFASLALVIAGSRPIPVEGHLETLGFGTWFGVRLPAIVLVAAMVLLGLGLHMTRFGRNVYALGSAPRAAYLAGVPTRRITVSLFVLNSVLTAAAGLIMTARLAAGDPRAGAGLELQVVAVTVLGGAALAGGRGSMLGTFLGVVLFGVISAALTFLQVPGAYQSLVTGGILIFAVAVTAIADLRTGRVPPDGPRLRRLAAALRVGALLRR
ncbi:ABC transporter permease [Streptomyces sp. NPDC096057]|uniref:ABC transporter permease n=1 Tax=Streptomyces sp. NPDC096057 TaxID=3155543 RepID=UPI00331775D2